MNKYKESANTTGSYRILLVDRWREGSIKTGSASVDSTTVTTLRPRYKKHIGAALRTRKMRDAKTYPGTALVNKAAAIITPRREIGDLTCTDVETLRGVVG